MMLLPVLLIVALIGTVSSLTASLTVDKSPKDLFQGESVKLEWTLSTSFSNASFLLTLTISVPSATNFITGGKSVFTIEAVNPFGKRLVVEGPVINVHSQYVYSMTLNNLYINDSMKFTGQFRAFSGGDVVDEAIASKLLVVKAYPEIIQPLLANLFLTDDSHSLSVIGSGKPQPTCLWGFESEVKECTVQALTTPYHYNYTIQLPSLTVNHCGKHLTYNLTGNGVTRSNSSIVNVLFTPDKVTSVTAFHEGENSIRVQWLNVQRGDCSVNYFVQYRTTGQPIDGNTTTDDTTKLFFPKKEERDKVTDVKVWASFMGKNGSDSDWAKVTASPPSTKGPTTTNTNTNTNGTSESGSNIVLIAAIVGGIAFVIIVIVIVVCVLKQKKNQSTIPSRDYQMQLQPRTEGQNENDYAMAPTREQNPDQMVYAELGVGGGRTGPRPSPPTQSNYAEVMVDGMGYPASGPKSDRPLQPAATYAVVDKSRRHSPPPPNDDDDHQGVIV